MLNQCGKLTREGSYLTHDQYDEDEEHCLINLKVSQEKALVVVQAVGVRVVTQSMWRNHHPRMENWERSLKSLKT